MHEVGSEKNRVFDGLKGRLTALSSPPCWCRLLDKKVPLDDAWTLHPGILLEKDFFTRGMHVEWLVFILVSWRPRYDTAESSINLREVRMQEESVIGSPFTFWKRKQHDPVLR